MSENKRIVTITTYRTSKYNPEKSRMSLQGAWLNELGFTPGKHVSVTIEKENDKPKLILKLID